MKKYLMLYCPYNPAHYMGHRKTILEAASPIEARGKAREFLRKNLWYTDAPFEVHLFEITHDDGPWVCQQEPKP